MCSASTDLFGNTMMGDPTHDISIGNSPTWCTLHCNMLYIKVGDFNGYIPVSGDFNDKMSNAILHCDCTDGNSSLQRDWDWVSSEVILLK